LFAYNVLKMGDSHVFTTVDSLRKMLDSRAENAKIGFVPTMGALHHGHISLVKQAMESCELVVVSIFVNPTQFNSSEDLIKYPRTLEKDVDLLNSAGEIVVFAPGIEDVYPANFENISVDLGDLGTVMEGKFRPGHFNGVMNVVKRLFDIVQPDYAFFGLKDFQQLAVIKFMTKALQLPVEIVACEIVREPSGLASSSRNV
jgi:pantoate--beta-alanine ligase